MGYIYKYLIFCILFLCSISAFSQVIIHEDFDQGTSFPNGWSSPSLPSFVITASNSCEGNSVRGPLNQNSIAPEFGFSSQVATGSDIVVKFDYKILEEASGDATDEDFGEFHLQFSIDDGKNWTTYHTIEQSTHTPSKECVPLSHTILASDVPKGSDFGWRVVGVYKQGNNYIYIDNFLAVEQVSCKQPIDIQIENRTEDSIEISWDDINSNSPTEWEVAYCPEGIDPDNPICFLNNVNKTTSNPYTITGLQDGTLYDIYVRAVCDANGNEVSSWTGPISVRTKAFGADCSTPYEVSTLPFTHTSDTEIYDNTIYNGSPGSACATVGDFLEGYNVVYKYTSAYDDILQIDLSGDLQGSVGVFVYESCSAIGNECLDGAVTSNGVDFGIQDFFVEAGKTYYIVVSTLGVDTTTKYTLSITDFDCASWGAPDGKGSYEFYNQTLADFSETRTGVNSTINDGELIWYEDASLTKEINDLSVVSLSDKDTFWVAQRIMYMGCVSPAIEVQFNEFDCTTLEVIDTWAHTQICDVGSTVLEASSSTDNLLWYDQETGGEPIAIGSQFHTSELNKNTSYWVSDFFKGEGLIEGQANPGPSALESYDTNTAGVEFEVYEPIVIKDVQVYVSGSAGDIIVYLEDNKGSVQERVINLPSGSAQSPTRVTLDLGFVIDDPNDGPFRLVKQSGPDMIGTLNTTTQFPYPIGSSGKITSGYASGTNSTYYYFYNWSVYSSIPLCESDRVEVEVQVNETFDVRIEAENETVCVGQEAKLEVSSLDLDYEYTWEWVDETGVTHNQKGSEMNTDLNQGTTFKVYAENPNTGCSTEEKFFIDVSGVGEIPIHSTKITACIGDVIELYAGKIEHTFENNITDWTFVNNSVTRQGVDPSVAGWKQVTSPYNAIENAASNDNSSFMISNADALGPASNVDAEMVSPALNLVGVSSASLEFYHYYKHHNNKVTTPRVMISIDNGTTWETLRSFQTNRGHASDFEKVSINLKEFLGNANVKIKFSYTGSWGWWWAIDNVSILQTYLDGQASWIGGVAEDNLYLDSNAKTPYKGEATNIVYFIPDEEGSFNFSVDLDIDGCADAVTNSITVEVNDAQAPVGPSEQEFNSGAKVLDINVIGDNLKYYLKIDEEYKEQSINSQIIDGETYYISQRIGDCESEYLEVNVQLICPTPEEVGVSVNLEDKGYTASAIIYWEHPANIDEIDAYQIIVRNDAKQIVENKKLSSRTNHLLIETLPLEASFTVDLYSICDEERELFSSIIELEFNTISLGVDDYKEVNLKYSPNPVTDILYIQSDIAMEDLILFDQNGKQILSKSILDSKNTQLDLSDLSTGVYLLKAKVGNQTRVLQIIKK